MKAWKFFSDPNRTVTDGNTGFVLFKFDGKGEYFTLDPILAKRMSPFFSYKEIELVEKTADEPEKEQEKEKLPKVYKCKHCEFESTDKMQYITHCRTHPKEE
jgi:hypothetical protein